MGVKLAINGGKPVRTKPFPKWPQFDTKEKKAVIEVLESGHWGKLSGKKVQEFEERFAVYQDAKYGIAVTNGTIGLRLALQAAGVQAGDEVLVPPYTFLATATAVLEVNAVPVFVDIDPDTYNINPNLIEPAITKRTKAIIPVHFAGLPAQMDKINRIARKHKLVVIEDACHAHGAEYQGTKLGAIGDMGVFSFQSSKNLTAGEGGMVLTNNKTYAELVQSYHNCGREIGRAWYGHVRLGGNHRMSEWQGAILLAQMTRLEAQTKRRNTNGLYLNKQLSEIPGIVPLKRGKEVVRHSYHLYIFRYKKVQFNNIPKQRFVKALQKEGIPCSIGYPIPLYKQPLFAERNFGSYAAAAKKINYGELFCPQCELACLEEAIWLSQSVMLGSKKDMDDIVRAIRKIQEHKDQLVLTTD
ncbi:MAG: DegT/DnrJ/EryC1/StrS family aminotransferase [bacterium]|nr:DegT/DnrJ/EryC1/StrS family aminotransferase [bacterium]